MQEFNSDKQTYLQIKKPKKNKKKKFFIIFLIIVGLIFLGVKVSNYIADTKNLKSVNQQLMEEGNALRSFVFGVCQLNGFSDDYYFVEGQTCASFFPDLISDLNEEINIEASFIDFINIFYADFDNNQDLRQQIMLIQDYSESKKYNPKDSLDLWQELTAVASNENIVKYLSDYHLNLQPEKDHYLLLENEKPSAQIYFDEKNNCLQAMFLPSEERLRLDNFSQVKIRAQYALEEFSDFNMQALAAIKEEKLDQSRFENYLLLGKHGKNVDTIILANLDYQKERATLISIPRDLWVDNRKINSYYYLFGIDGLISKIESLTGQQVANYILIDMYAFPEVVDKLGGIDYYFIYPLIDPTYKTVDDGVEGTLYFPAGQAHLNGIQALRVARSRHTTSDFARAQRQQEILTAVESKISETKKSEISKLVPTILQKVDTDFNVAQLISLVMKVKDFEICSGNVISTGNILTSTYFEFGQENSASSESQKGTGQRAYILIPQEDDWSLIKKYIVNAIYRD